jgi:hypothetical protein
MEDKTKNYIIDCPAMATFLGVIGPACIGGAELICP